jgi:hypothetical protein
VEKAAKKEQGSGIKRKVRETGRKEMEEKESNLIKKDDIRKEIDEL